PMDTLHPDSLVIERLGGPVKLARRLGISNRQRVQNWKARGIPADVLLANPWLRRKVMQARAEAERAGQEMVNAA
ncbi:YdaS family helix-turn-helix protein, partial [Pseudomonas sp.]|uniref:YdaS family helix-turn-helix protein n=1 Tax=Pseudomonas sp. TaxID=306 RepID=UPI0028A69D1F